jgi:hypothetical protein
LGFFGFSSPALWQVLRKIPTVFVRVLWDGCDMDMLLLDRKKRYMKTTKALLGIVAITLALPYRVIVSWALELLVLLTLPVAAQAQLTFTTNNGAITITGYEGTPVAVTIPDSTNGLTVTSIGDEAFYGRSSLTSVTIPDTVTDIQDGAFYYCSGLTTVTIPNSVTYIGKAAFHDCSGLTNVTIPSSVTYIGAYAFDSCDSLTSVAIPKSVTSIGDAPFAFCYSLQAITVDPANTYYSSTNGVLFDKNQTKVIQWPDGIGGSYTLPNSVTTIGNAAFQDSVLTNVTMDSSLTAIGDWAFQPGSLTSVTIPGSVTSIGTKAFQGCTSLTYVCFEGNAPTDGGSIFSGDSALSTLYYVNGTAGWRSTFSDVPTAPCAECGVQATAAPLFQPPVLTTSGQIILSWMAPQGSNYQLQYTTNLSSTNWINIGSIMTASNTLMSATDSTGSGQQRFYRVQQQ